MPAFEPEPGVTVHYDDVGRGRPLVLVHGWSMSARAFAPQVAALSAAGWRVLVPEWRGHGRSSPAARHAIHDHARDLAALFAREDLSGAALAGWSMGGQVVLAALPALGGRVSALALLSSTPRFAAGDGWEHGLAEASVRALAARLARRPRPTLERFFDAMFAEGELDEAARAALARELLAPPQPDATAASAGLDALLASDERARLADVCVPALLVHGEADPICLAAASRWMHARLPGSRLELLPGLGHAPQLSRPALVSGLLGRFFAEAAA